MATVNKNFKIKSGLVVEGTTGTINGEDILTTSQASTDHIVNIVGGTTLVTSVESTQLEVLSGELNVKPGVFDAAGAADTAEANAIAAAALDATLKADAAQSAATSAAETFATNADTTLYGTVTSDIATAKSEAGVIAQGYATTAENNANDYTDSAITNLNLGSTYDAYGSASTAASQALSDANAYADSLTTSDIAEGTNEYFTADRAQDAVATALSNGTHTNITVAYDDAANSISLTGAVTYTDEDARDAIGTALTAGANAVVTVDDAANTITVAVDEDIVLPSTGSLEVQSNDVNFGAPSLGLRATDGYVNPLAVFSGDHDDDYAQVVIKNTGSGVNSSSDLQLYANNGNDIDGGWVDLGITSSTFSDPGFTITSPNDGYIFMEAPVGTSGNGDFVIATGANGARNAIVFAAGGLQSDNTQMTILPDESVVIAINTPSTSPSTGALVVQGGVGIQGDVNIEGNINFGGAGTSLTTENLAVTDPLIYVGDQNAGDAVDMGIVTEYKDGATTKFAGVVRDASDGVFKVFSNATTKPTSVVNFAEAGLAYGDLKVDEIVAHTATLTNVTIGAVDQNEIAHLNGVTSSIQNQLDSKQGNLTAGTGVTITGDTVSVTGNTYDAYGAASSAQTAAEGYADTAATDAENAAKAYADGLASNYDAAGAASSAQTAAQSYADGLAANYDAAGSAATAEYNAKGYADGLASNYDAAGAASSAQTAAQSYADSLASNYEPSGAITTAINALTTDDIPEETLAPVNRYFTDARAKTAAADLLTSASLTNITITGDGNGITITAENGVAGSTTSDLAEGTNLYFTDARAVEALYVADIRPATVEINSFRKEEATQQYIASASTVDVHSFGYPHESAKYLVRVVGWVGGVKHSQMSEILVTVDGNDNIAITEYGTIYTDSNPLATFSARVDNTGSTRYVLTATTAGNGFEVIAAATLLSWAD
jgi:hypothetical protein